MNKKTIIWFRNDLRLADNEALNYAHQNHHQSLFLYILDKSFSIGSASKWFLFQALSSFKENIKQKYGANLIIKVGDPLIILDNLAEKYRASCLIWNRVYEPAAIKRDTKITAYFKQKGLVVQTFNSSLLFEPTEIKNNGGGYFKVFTPFWKKCLTKIDNIGSPHRIPTSFNLIEVDQKEGISLHDLNLLPKNSNWAKNWNNLYTVNEQYAKELIEKFMINKMENYKENRDFPANNDTSLISPYLHFGLVSPRQIYFKSKQYSVSNGSIHFLNEIGWREFSYSLLYYFPDLPEKNFKADFDHFPWRNDDEDLKKWQRGMTGFPLVDAGMRQLWRTGWMHNRVRMVVASFLIKNLLIDWRIGQAWFWDCLVDADLAANSASWQWIAGSGADAAPYFRIFNPIRQSEKFDTKGEYIRRWIPEIANLSNKEIHFPIKRDKYPKAMIDLNFSRNRALSFLLKRHKIV